MVIAFKEFLKEEGSTAESATVESSAKPRPVLASTVGPETERHIKKYITPYLEGGKHHADSNGNRIEGTHLLASDHEGLTAGTSLTLHNHEIRGNKHYAQVSTPGSTKKHWIVTSKIRKPGVNTNEQAEASQIQQIANHIDEHVKKNGSMLFRAPDGTMHNVTGVRKQKGTEKADFYLHNEKGEPVYYGSLKKTSQAKGFNGYGGISKVTDNLKDIVNTITTHLTKSPLGKGESVFHKLDSNNRVHEKAVSQVAFGHKFGSGQYSENNVNGIHHGAVRFQKHPDGGYGIASDLDIINDGEGSTIEKLEKAHGNHIGIFVRNGEKEGGELRKVPGTETPGRAMVASENTRDPSKIENITSKNINEDLRKWFDQKWVRMDTKGEIKGDCAREEGEGKPKCLPQAKAYAMDKEDRAKAVRRKRREDPVADRQEKGGKPVNVATEAVNLAQQAAIAIAMKKAGKKPNNEELEHLEEKNAPTNPALWSRAKSLAKQKFDVYPSAYANGWAAKWYKSEGGGWKSVSEEVEIPDDITKKLTKITKQLHKSVSAHGRQRDILMNLIKKDNKDVKEEVVDENCGPGDITFENFMDGKGPGKPGDSARHGLKGKTTAELKSIRSSDKASPRKKQLAHFMLNMTRKESSISEEIAETPGFKTPIIRFKQLIQQDLTHEQLVQHHVENFMEYAKQHLDLKQLPKVELVNNKKIAHENTSFGSYYPSEKTIKVNIAGRHPADILRTLAHEMVHHKQNLEGKLDDIAMAGETGSTCENEANSEAGIILRNYGRAKPSIYENYNILQANK